MKKEIGITVPITKSSLQTIELQVANAATRKTADEMHRKQLVGMKAATQTIIVTGNTDDEHS